MPNSRSRRLRPNPAQDRNARDRGDPRGGPSRGPASWLQVAGLALVVAKVTLVPVVLDPAAAQAFALPKSAVSRALLYPTVAVLAAYFALHPERRPRGPLVWAIGAYGVVAIASTAFAVHVPTALYGALGRYLGLTSILDGIVLAVAIMTFVRTPREVAWVLGGILAGASVALAYALAQIAGMDPVKWTAAQTASTMGNSGALGGLLVCGAATALAVLAVRWRALPWSLRLPLALLDAAATVMVFTIGTRSAELAAPVAVIVVGAAVWRARHASLVWPNGRAPAIAAVLVLATLAAGSALVATRTPAGARVLALAQGGDFSLGERALIYRAALEAFRSHPLLGAGPDSFIAIYPSVRPVEITAISGGWMQDSTHSWFLHHLVGTGAIGLAALLVVAGVAVWSGFRRGGELGPTVGVVGIVTFIAQGTFSISHVGTDVLFWAFVGLADASALVPGSRPVATRAHRSRMAPLWLHRASAVVFLALGVALASTTVASIDASRKILLSDRARARGDFAGATWWAERAVALDPGRADYWNVLGRASAQDPSRAIEAFGRAHQAAPYDPTYLLNLAFAEASRADKSARSKGQALADAKRAAEIDPNNPITQRQAAQILWSLGDLDAAIRLIEHTIVLASRPEDHYELAADIYETAGRTLEAIDRLERLVARRWPDGNVPLDMRRRLARLYYEVRDSEKLARILSPPRAVEATICAPTCLQVRFESTEDLRTDDSPGSAINPVNYRLRGRPLPVGSRTELRGPTVVVVILPVGTAPLTTGDSVEVARIQDAYGRVISPDPTVLTVR